MANAAENFIKGFIEGTMKKKRYGHYYVVIYNGVKFLLHHNPEKGSGRYRGKEKPYLMLVRDTEGNVLICAENSNFVERHVDVDYLRAHTDYYFSLQDMEKGHLDVTEWRVLDTKVIPRQMPTEQPGVVIDTNFKLTLYNIDGIKYLSDLEYSLPSQTVRSWLAFDDFQLIDPRTVGKLGLLKLPGNPKTVDEARIKQLNPLVVGKPDLQLLGTAVIVPVEDCEVAYPRDLIEAVASAYRGWERLPSAALGFDGGVPMEAGYRRNSTLCDGLSDDAKARENRWRKAEEKRRHLVKAFSNKLNGATQRLTELGIASSDVRVTDDGIFIRESCLVAHPTNNTNISATMGETWHKVVPFAGR